MPTAPKKSCFVASPIGAENSDTRSHADWLYLEIISNVIDRHFSDLFTVTRADKINDPGMIDGQIINHLLDDDLVVADLSKLNPNVFYELGIRHMIEKPIIHMHQAETAIPFDISLFRSIEFSYTDPNKLVLARDAFRRAVDAVLADDYTVRNPVIVARGQQKLHESATPATELLIAELQTVSQRLARLEFAKDNHDRAVKSLMVSDTIARALLAAPKIDPAFQAKVEMAKFFESIEAAKDTSLAEMIGSIDQNDPDK